MPKRILPFFSLRWGRLLLLLILLGGEALALAETVRVASISFVPEKFALDVNVARLKTFYREAAQKGAQIALAPEGILEGYVVNEVIAGEVSEERMRSVALRIDGRALSKNDGETG